MLAHISDIYTVSSYYVWRYHARHLHDRVRVVISRGFSLRTTKQYLIRVIHLCSHRHSLSIFTVIAAFIVGLKHFVPSSTSRGAPSFAALAEFVGGPWNGHTESEGSGRTVHVTRRDVAWRCAAMRMTKKARSRYLTRCTSSGVEVGRQMGTTIAKRERQTHTDIAKRSDKYKVMVTLEGLAGYDELCTTILP